MIEWIKNAIIYEIYPTSFYDSNNDGIGDLKGIIKKVDYIKSLGVNTVWFNPFFESPFKDGGYDISDFLKIDPKFGTMKDFDNMIKVFHKNNIRVIIDLVIGHTSDKHKWFINSCKEKRNKYSDYYIWTDQIFKGYDGKTLFGLAPREGGYYVNFFAFQPGLNYGFNKVEDPGYQLHYKDPRLIPLRNEIINIMRFYLKKGVDGFRVDMAASLVKGCNNDDVEGLSYVWEELQRPIRKEFPEAIFTAEWSNPINSIGKCGFDIDLLLHDIPPIWTLSRCEEDLSRKYFDKISYFDKSGKGTFEVFANFYSDVCNQIKDKGALCVQTGCHDVARLASFKNKNQLKLFFAFLLTFRFIPLIYYGDEIEMKHNIKVKNKDGGYFRTGCRTPMQWDSSKNRGFSKADKLYLPTNNDSNAEVSKQEKNPKSLLNLFRKLTKLRNEYSCLSMNGDIEIIEINYPTIYKRSDEKNTIYIYLNPSNNIICRSENDYKEVLLSHNAKIVDSNIILGKESFLILRK